MVDEGDYDEYRVLENTLGSVCSCRRGFEQEGDICVDSNGEFCGNAKGGEIGVGHNKGSARDSGVGGCLKRVAQTHLIDYNMILLVE